MLISAVPLTLFRWKIEQMTISKYIVKPYDSPFLLV